MAGDFFNFTLTFQLIGCIHSRKGTFSFRVRELWPMTLTFKHELDTVKLHHRVKYLGQRSFRSKVIVRTHRHTHETDCSTWTIKAFGNKGNLSSWRQANKWHRHLQAHSRPSYNRRTNFASRWWYQEQSSLSTAQFGRTSDQDCTPPDLTSIHQ